MAVSMKIDTTKVHRMLGGMDKRIKNDRAFMDKIWGDVGLKDVDDHFRKEMDDNGKRWARFLYKGKRVSTRPYVGGSKLLQDVGNLRQSIEKKSLKHSIILWTDREGARALNYGYKDRNLVARKFMWISDRAKTQMANSYAYYIVQGKYRG